ncbi:FtsK/SpoIIIE domain-containing protein [Kutzneria buriramensis]|uniref:S-DNA-T family DNA segregation ATPase FtsK/SpoIIIE n=1 Tax=Kutzneria buriramensis TaxID=1045776 RepID=A0A3E0GW23_9PSEU|nr:FtsK/SpoIIIE domain-containing protein [Kutzneria buriramensis]REH30677.1 S-DNA-T family DNA segregation ATPase FtsK/SpoIIIE [Kutzneria buriramensis]
MKLKLTLRRSGRPDADLLVTVDARTKIGELAQYLAGADPTGSVTGDSALTIAVVGREHLALDPWTAVGDTTLCCGATIALVPGGRTFADPSMPVATLRIVDGPDVGREFPLRTGSSVIGREHDCTVRLTDPLVSRRHARVNVTDVVDITDLGSANGMQIGESQVSHTVLRPGETVRLGDTELALVSFTPAVARGAAVTTVEFVRSPRLDPRYVGVEFAAPTPPQRPHGQRFPMLSVLAPILMGVVLYAVTGSLLSLLFVGLSPLMMIGGAVETKWGARKDFRLALRLFRSDVDDLVADVRRELEREAVERDREHPATGDCVDAVRTRAPLLWTRRPDDRGFLELRLATGALPSRFSVRLPDTQALPRDLVAELAKAVDPLGVVAGVPIVARPGEHGAIGVAGPRPVMLGVARALVTQLVALHSPAEVVLTAFASSESARDWEWLRWLPHTTSPHSPINCRQLTSSTPEATALAAELDALLERREAGGPGPAVFVLVEDDAPIDRSRLVELAERGWKLGIHVLWLAGDTTGLPAACRAFVSVEHGPDRATVGFGHDGHSVTSVVVETLDAGTVAELGRALSPLVDAGARLDDDSDLPKSVSLVSVPEEPMAMAPAAVLEQWTANQSVLTGPYAPEEPIERAGTLRAVIGMSATGPHALDLRADGPHALVGGTTGAGKSELLQAWLLAMAAAHSPQRLTFLLVDYKGGSAFHEVAELPHTVGIVTDLGPHQARRALESLTAELRRREEILAKHKVKDLVQMEKDGHRDAPPSLVIVVDEFAALVAEIPEFVDGVVNIAQRGRSLGLHLILATQRPAGVIKENLRANTNLRLALRMADEADSMDVLGSPQAAFFDPEAPGRAVSKTGPGRLVPFQTGYAGGWTTAEGDKPEIVVEELRFGRGRKWTLPKKRKAVLPDPGPTDIQRLVEAVRQAAEHARLPRPTRPWLPELEPVYDLHDLYKRRRNSRDSVEGELVFAIEDDPHDQEQRPVVFHPDVDGNLAVYGTGGAGKSTLLRSIAIAAGFTGGCHVYGLDFGARGLAMLEELPHVGSVIPGSEHERVVRLLRWLRAEIDERAVRFSQAHAGSLGDYRSLSGDSGEPRILLLLDGMSAFRQAYEVGEHSRWYEVLLGIAADGRNVGVHLVLSADRLNAVPTALGSAMQRRVVLRMADPTDYTQVGMAVDVLGPSSPPGRGMLGGAEIQVAVLGSQPDVNSQAAGVRRLAAAMTGAGLPAAPPIRQLADQIPLSELPVLEAEPVLGVASDSLAPFTFRPTGSFVVCGPPGSGRTTTLRAIAAALLRWQPDRELHYFGLRQSELGDLPCWASAARTVTEHTDHARQLAERLDSWVPGDRPVAVFLESVNEISDGPAGAPLLALAKRCLQEGHLLVVEGETTVLSNSYNELVKYAKSGRCGLALQPDTNDGTTVFHTPFPPRLRRADFPPGRALLVTGGRTAVVQVANPEPVGITQ